MLGKFGHILPVRRLDNLRPLMRVRPPPEQFAERVSHAPAVFAWFRRHERGGWGPLKPVHDRAAIDGQPVSWRYPFDGALWRNSTQIPPWFSGPPVHRPFSTPPGHV